MGQSAVSIIHGALGEGTSWSTWWNSGFRRLFGKIVAFVFDFGLRFGIHAEDHVRAVLLFFVFLEMMKGQIITFECIYFQLNFSTM